MSLKELSLGWYFSRFIFLRCPEFLFLLWTAVSIDSIVVLKGGIYSSIIGKKSIYRIRVECNKRFSLGRQCWQPYMLCMTLSILSGKSYTWPLLFNHSMATQNIGERRKEPLIQQYEEVSQKRWHLNHSWKKILTYVLIYKQLLRRQFLNQCYTILFLTVLLFNISFFIGGMEDNPSIDTDLYLRAVSS